MMKDKFLDLIKNFSYSLSANFISLLISSLVVLVVPKLIGVEQYGFWQIYIFYSSYVGFLHFGWNDGIYLRYGGEDYEKLNKANFFSQFYSLLFSQLLVAISLIASSFIFIQNFDRKFILTMIAIQVLIVNTRLMLLYILQATNRIKEYSLNTILDRIVYLILIITLLVLGIDNYYLLIFADLIGKSIGLIYAMYVSRDIVFRKLADFSNVYTEARDNINSGIKLMLSNIANTLIIGIVRFGIERNWSVSIFGKISLSLSVSNMFMVFLNALGMVIYPILRRINHSSLVKAYSIMRDFLMTFALGMLIFYMPVKVVLSLWLPQYAVSLNYLGMLLPIVIYESKMSLLINTYMKALRLENVMLKFNTFTMIISVAFTGFSAFWLHNLDFTILSIVILIGFRGIIAECILSRTLEISVVRDILLETFMTIIFIYTAWYINSNWTPIIYGFFYILYLIIKKNDLKISLNYILEVLKK
ncbi:hypothetical protein FOB80_07755 [Aerococcus viridans]|nr:hypothetical protein FOB80_07755 [Aerococcus viridans]